MAVLGGVQVEGRNQDLTCQTDHMATWASGHRKHCGVKLSLSDRFGGGQHGGGGVGCGWARHRRCRRRYGGGLVLGRINSGLRGRLHWGRGKVDHTNGAGGGGTYLGLLVVGQATSSGTAGV